MEVTQCFVEYFSKAKVLGNCVCSMISVRLKEFQQFVSRSKMFKSWVKKFVRQCVR